MAFDPTGATLVDQNSAPAADQSAPASFDPTGATLVDSSATPNPSMLDTVNHWAGLANRAILGGAAGLPSELAGVVQGAGEEVADKLGYKPSSAPAASGTPIVPYSPQLSDFVHPEKWQEAAQYFADHSLGTPQPATPAERVFSQGVSAAPSVVLAPEAPVAGAVSAMLGGASAQATAEAGGGPIAQTLAGLAGGGLGAAGAVGGAAARAAIRGGAAGQAATQGALADAAASRTTLSAGQASGSKLLQTLEGTSTKLWGGGPLRRLADTQTQNIGSRVSSIVDNLSQGSDVSPTAAGTAINTGVAATKQNMRGAEKAAYSNVDNLVPPQSPIDVSGTLGTLKGLVTPTPGAAQSTAALVPAKIADMHANLTADIAANGGTPQLPYEAASALKTAVGNSIDWGFAPSNPVQNGALKQVYGSLKNDIDTGAAAISPAAAQAVSDAKSLYATNQAQRDALNPIIDRAGGPEAVFQAATNGTKQGATKIGQVMGALNPDQQNIVRATVLDRLGRGIPSTQDAAGSIFSPNTFLTKWNTLAPEAKDALFGSSNSGPPGTLRSSLDSLANTTSIIRGSTLFKNPSGTGEAGGHAAGLYALLEGLGTGGGMALFGRPGAEDVLMGAASTAAASGANNLMARVLTNPRTAQWLARSTKAPISSLPNAVNQLSQLGQRTKDQDAADLASFLATPQPTARASGGRVDHDALTAQLIGRWKAAKKASSKTTEPLLDFPDAAITRALTLAAQHR